MLPRALLILATLLSAPVSRAAEWLSTCPGKAERVRFEASSALELRPALFGKAPGEAVRAEAVAQQVRFYQRSLQEAWGKEGIQLIISAAPPRIRMLGRAAGKASAAIEAGKIEHPDVKVEHPYILAGIAKGLLAKGEPVEKVRFSASWEGISCGQRRLPASTRVRAPLDPFLAFWIAPPAERKLTRWQESEFVLSPVFEGEYADIPDPFYAWYFWKPGAWGRAGTVAEATVASRVIGKVKAFSLPRIEGPELRATVIFGVVDAKRKAWKPSESFPSKEGGANELAKALETMRGLQAQPGLDRGSLYAIDFLSNLHHVFEGSELRYRWENDWRVLHLEGAAGGKRVKLRYYFGPTDLLAGEPPAHWRLAADALGTDDLVVYNGHSGLGENFARRNIEKFAEAPVRQRAGQLLAVLSCYSFFYLSEQDAPGGLLLTGSDYTSARGPLGLLIQLTKGGKGNPPFTEPGDFLILKAGMSHPRAGRSSASARSRAGR